MGTVSKIIPRVSINMPRGMYKISIPIIVTVGEKGRPITQLAIAVETPLTATKVLNIYAPIRMNNI